MRLQDRGRVKSRATVSVEVSAAVGVKREGAGFMQAMMAVAHTRPLELSNRIETAPLLRRIGFWSTLVM